MNFKNVYYKLTHWESWHYLLKYVPIMPVWLWYCIKARSFWFFTPSNPSLTFGGFEGESKREMYEQLPSDSYPPSLYIDHLSSWKDLHDHILKSNLSFPFAVKPDVGMMGFMFRKIESLSELQDYHKIIKADYIIQDFVTYPLEVSVFYYRFPEEARGNITGFLRKDLLSVVGDGHSTLDLLIDQNSRARLRSEELKSKHRENLHKVLTKDQEYHLSFALNLSRGGKLVSLAHEIDEELIAVFDKISRYTKSFYYGRYDIKCASVCDLKKGKNFTILEYNGCGAEPHHAYGNGNTLLQAYRIFLHHWQVLYKISLCNRKKGIQPWRFDKGYKHLSFARKHFKRLKALDMLTRVS